MNASEARAITEKNKDIPSHILNLLWNIKNLAESGESQLYIRHLPQSQKKWLLEKGYKTEDCKHVFGAGNRPEKAIKISW